MSPSYRRGEGRSEIITYGARRRAQKRQFLLRLVIALLYMAYENMVHLLHLLHLIFVN